MKKKIAILFGGQSTEHEVSRVSATSVLKNIDNDKYVVYPIGITKDGQWFQYKGNSQFFMECMVKMVQCRGSANL